MLFDFDQLAAAEAADHLRRVVLSGAPHQIEVMDLQIAFEDNADVLSYHTSDDHEDWTIPTMDQARVRTTLPRRHRQACGRNRRARNTAKPYVKSVKSNSTMPRKPNLLNCWCSFVVALVRREDGYGWNRRRLRLFKAETQLNRQRQLGLEEHELMPGYERWRRSPFLEEHSDPLRIRPPRHGSRACAELHGNNSNSQAKLIVEKEANTKNRSDCVPCGCSSEFDKYGDRVCLCDSCQKGCQLAASEREVQANVLPLPSGADGSSSRWRHIIASMLEVVGVTFGAGSMSRKQLQMRKLQPSAVDIRRWSRLHDANSGQVAPSQQRAQYLCEAPPLQLTLSHQHAHMEALEQKRFEKRMRSRWSRMLLAMHTAHRRKSRREALHELAEMRRTRRGTLHDSLHPLGEPRSLQVAGVDVPRSDLAISGDEEIVLAAQLGLDVATYFLLRQLEEREILPEDYDLLGRLDEAVKPKTLSNEDLDRFETKTYATPLMLFGTSLAEFGMDYWRLPLAALAHEEDANSDVRCFGIDFWKLPMSMVSDADEMSTIATDDGDAASYLNSVNVCGVCLVDFDDGDELRVLPCGHYFHRECIDHWLLNSSTLCPVDKRDLQLQA